MRFAFSMNLFFSSHPDKAHSHKTGFALSLVLKNAGVLELGNDQFTKTLCKSNHDLNPILTPARPRRSASSCSSVTPREKAPTHPKAFAAAVSHQRAGLYRRR